MVYPHVQDEFDEAMSDPVRGFHGQVSIEAYRIAWPKGDFRAHAVYDPNTHKGGDWQQTVMINIIVTPLDPTRKLIAREIPQFAREFVGVIRPSIEALAAKIAAIKGQDVKAINPLREINKLWVAGEFVPRPDNKAGETWTTIKFVDVWATREECEAHANQSTDAENGDAATEPAPNPDAQRATLAAFLPAMWAQAGKDKAKMEELIKANSLLAGFTIDSPEVQAVIA